MIVEIFIEELRGRYQPFGKLNVVRTTNASNHSEPSIDDVWLVENNPSGIDVHILKLQAQHPTVVIDVPEHFSLNFPLGSSTYDVMQKANKGYSDIPQKLISIKNYSDIILDAYNATIAYNKATMLLCQYQATDKADLLQEAYQALKGLILYSSKNSQLMDTISGLAKSRNIDLNLEK